MKHAFTIVRTDKKDKTTYMVNTKEEKDAWVSAINHCIINVPKLSNDKKDTREIREATFAGTYLISILLVARNYNSFNS